MRVLLVDNHDSYTEKRFRPLAGPRQSLGGF
jgi:hypothetical protein